MQEATVARLTKWFRIVAILILAAGACFYIVESIGWRWQWDTSVMHYFAFLMNHGKAPYRDIIDMNMPGSYFMESWAMAVFGGGDLGWRIYEYLLLAGLTASTILIALPYDWFAGLFAGVLFALFHGGDGPRNAVQREEVMTVLIMAGFAFLFAALRRRRAWLVAPFGFLVGLAGMLKPTAAPLGVVVLAIAVIELRRRKESLGSYVCYGVLGFSAAGLVLLNFFLRNHDAVAFFEISKRLLPFYASMENVGFGALVGHGLLNGHGWQALLLITLVLTLAAPDWKNWEKQALVLGICFGAFSFVAQRKGFDYHLYPFMAFMFLWIGLEVAGAMRAKGWVRAFGVAGVAIGLFYLLPQYARRMSLAKSETALGDALVWDLERLGGSKLQNQVQCMDMVSGCTSALFRLNLVGSSEFPGDMVLFGPPGNPATTYYRGIFWDDIHKAPPKVIVITNARLVLDNSFAKLEQWPEFVDFLNSNYDLVSDRSMGLRTDVPEPPAYRIYVLKADKQLAQPVSVTRLR